MNIKHFVFVNCFCALMLFSVLVVAKEKYPVLPEIKFAAIQNPHKFRGDRWSYMEAGKTGAPVLIALHGIGGNSMDWRFQLSGLSNKYRVIAWNAPGYYLSDQLVNEKPGCEDYANALADFLDALKLQKVSLIANSFGSRVAQCFAVHHAPRVEKMVLIGPSAGRSDWTEQLRNKILDERRAQVAEGGYQFASKRVSILLGKRASPELIELVSHPMQATNPAAFMQAAYLTVSSGYSPVEIGPLIKAKVMLIAGTEDRVSPMETNAMLLHNNIRGSDLHVLKDVGHLPHIESPVEVNRLIDSLLAK